MLGIKARSHNQNCCDQILIHEDYLDGGSSLKIAGAVPIKLKASASLAS
jgi:hypothetical protein